MDPRYVYLLKFENGLKFGFAGNIDSKIKSYYEPWNRHILKGAILKCQYPKMVVAQIQKKYAILLKYKCQEFLPNYDYLNLKDYILSIKTTRPEGVETDIFWESQQFKDIPHSLENILESYYK